MPINEDHWVSRKKLIGTVGEAGALRVIEIFGGARIWVPRIESKNFPPLAAKLGAETARKLCTEFGDMRVYIPRRLQSRCDIRDQILKLRGKLSAPEISRQLGCSERYVYAILARH